MNRTPSPVTALPRLVLFSRSMSQPALIESLDLALRVSTEFQYRATESIDLVKEIVSRSTRAVILANCITKEDITDLYNALPAISARVSEGTVRVIVLNTIHHPKLPELLRVRCPVEVIDLPATEKNIHYKLKNSFISVHQNYLKKDKAKGGESEADPDVLWQSPIDYDFDFWWVSNPKQIRRVVGVWLIDLVGPGPSAGTWEAVPGFDRGGEKAWEWKPRWLADEAFQTPGGRWIFFGNLPEFSWQKAMWTFVSRTPGFAYFSNESSEAKYTRFEYKPDEGLIFFQNSQVTQRLLARIQATLENRADPVRDSEVADGLEVVDQFRVVEPENEPELLRSVGRSVLEAKAGLGLGTVADEGVTAGAAAYAQSSFGVDVIRKNGRLGTADLLPPKIYEVTRTHATLMLEPPLAKIGDRFHFRFSFDLGERHTEALMEWELTQIEMAFENQLLASGEFVSGDFAPLNHALDKAEDRRRELREFYRGARG